MRFCRSLYQKCELAHKSYKPFFYVSTRLTTAIYDQTRKDVTLFVSFTAVFVTTGLDTPAGGLNAPAKPALSPILLVSRFIDNTEAYRLELTLLGHTGA